MWWLHLGTPRAFTHQSRKSCTHVNFLRTPNPVAGAFQMPLQQDLAEARRLIMELGAALQAMLAVSYRRDDLNSVRLRHLFESTTRHHTTQWTLLGLNGLSSRLN
jgi:hypothetical protein